MLSSAQGWWGKLQHSRGQRGERRKHYGRGSEAERSVNAITAARWVRLLKGKGAILTVQITMHTEPMNKSANLWTHRDINREKEKTRRWKNQSGRRGEKTVIKWRWWGRCRAERCILCLSLIINRLRGTQGQQTWFWCVYLCVPLGKIHTHTHAHTNTHKQQSYCSIVPANSTVASSEFVPPGFQLGYFKGKT